SFFSREKRSSEAQPMISPSRNTAAVAQCVSLIPRTIKTRRSYQQWSLRFELEILVRGGERVIGDEAQARLRHPRSVRADRRALPDRGEPGLVVDEPLDPLEKHATALLVGGGRQLAPEILDVGIASVDIRAARGHPGLQPCRRVAERAAADEDHVPQTLFLDRLEEAGALDGLKDHPDPDRSQIVADRFRNGR